LDLQARRENLRGRVLLAVLPMEEQDECHKAINRELLTVRVPCKCMVRQTFFGFQRTTRFHLYNIIACIYERSLEVGEGMWILRDGAGNRNDPEVHGTPEQVPPLSQVYIGFDVSRVRGKPEVASYAAICEPHGRVITTQDKSFSGEYLTSTDVEQIITSTMTAFQPARRRLGLPLTGEIVFFKDGTSRGGAQERELEAGLERTAEALIGSGRAMRGLSVNYVDVTKGIIHRIFSTGRKVPQGTAIINEDFEHPEVIIVTTDPFGELSHQPNRLTLRKSIGPEGMADIRRIARQYYDLRFLHFETWRVQPGAALPLHIVQNKAKQRAYGYDTVYIPK
jgi:hypothetical protein